MYLAGSSSRDDSWSNKGASPSSKRPLEAATATCRSVIKDNWTDLGEGCYVGYFPRYLTPGEWAWGKLILQNRVTHAFGHTAKCGWKCVKVH